MSTPISDYEIDRRVRLMREAELIDELRNAASRLAEIADRLEVLADFGTDRNV